MMAKTRMTTVPRCSYDLVILINHVSCILPGSQLTIETSRNLLLVPLHGMQRTHHGLVMVPAADGHVRASRHGQADDNMDPHPARYGSTQAVSCCRDMCVRHRHYGTQPGAVACHEREVGTLYRALATVAGASGRPVCFPRQVHLTDTATPQDEKACFSRVGRPSKADFEIRFSDSQELQKLRKKMLRTRKVLEASVDIVGNWEQLSRDLDACSSVRRAHGQAPFRPGYQQCRNLQSTLRYHLGIIAQLCDYSAHTEKLVSSARLPYVANTQANLTPSSSSAS